MQFALIPKEKPDLPGYEFWHHYEPARFVGGDYFDYRPVLGAGALPARPSSRWAIAVGDVAGKGMPAALLMAKLYAEVGLVLQAEPDPARAVERLNRHLCETGNDGAVHHVPAGRDRRRPARVDGGQRRAHGPDRPPRRRSVEVIGRERSADAAGRRARADAYEPVRTAIGPGDVVVLYTDGDQRCDGHRRDQPVSARSG